MSHIILLAQVQRAQKLIAEIQANPDSEELEAFSLAIEQAASCLDWAHKALWKWAYDGTSTDDDVLASLDADAEPLFPDAETA